MKRIIIFTLLTISAIVNAQESYLKDYSWSENPNAISQTDEQKLEEQYFLKHKESVELITPEAGSYEICLTHKQIVVNSDDAIERFNKVYVPSSNVIEVLKLKARVILPNGKVINIDKNNIQESKDEHGNIAYKYYALEGVEKGSVIEYLHLTKEYPNFSGSKFTPQNAVNKYNVDFELISPKHLGYGTKSINGMAEMVYDTLTKDFNRWSVTIDTLSKLKKEATSSYKAQLQKVYFKLAVNYDRNRRNLYNFNSATKAIYARFYDKVNKKELKAIKKFANGFKFKDDLSDEEKVRIIENKVKSSISIIKNYFEGNEDLDFILGNNIASAAGVVKLYVNTFKFLDIKHELVYTTNRNEDRFEDDFQSYILLKDVLIKISKAKKYLAPENIIYRLGVTPPENINQNGLFIKEQKVGDFYAGISKVKFIDFTKSSKNQDIINTSVKFMDDFSVEIDAERSVSGQKAVFYQGILNYIPADELDEFKEGLLTYLDEDAKLELATFENDNSSFLGVKPFVGKGLLKSESFTETAGDKVLFKVGKLIGPQAELYNKDERKLPVEMEFCREYNRIITVEIPEGYTVKNLNELNMEVLTKEDVPLTGFKSSYTLKDGKLVVKVEEWYKTLHYDAKDYIAYADVINAAADFNKITLVLEKN